MRRHSSRRRNHNFVPDPYSSIPPPMFIKSNNPPLKTLRCEEKMHFVTFHFWLWLLSSSLCLLSDGRFFTCVYFLTLRGWDGKVGWAWSYWGTWAAPHGCSTTPSPWPTVASRQEFTVQHFELLVIIVWWLCTLKEPILRIRRYFICIWIRGALIQTFGSVSRFRRPVNYGSTGSGSTTLEKPGELGSFYWNCVTSWIFFSVLKSDSTFYKRWWF